MVIVDNSNVIVPDSGGGGSSTTSWPTENPGAKRYYINDKTLDELYPLYSYCTHIHTNYKYLDGSFPLDVWYNQNPGDVWNVTETVSYFSPIHTIVPGTKPCFGNGSNVGVSYKILEAGGITGWDANFSMNNITFIMKKENDRLKITRTSSPTGVVFDQPASYFRDKVLPRRLLFLAIGGGGAGYYDSAQSQGGSAGCWLFGVLNLDALINNDSNSYYTLTVGGSGWWDWDGEDQQYVSKKAKATTITYGPNKYLAASAGEGHNGENTRSYNQTKSTVVPNAYPYANSYCWRIDYGIGASGGYGTGLNGGRYHGVGVDAKPIYATGWGADRSLIGNTKTLSGGDGGSSHNNDGGGGGGASILANGGNGSAGTWGTVEPTPGSYGSGGGSYGYNGYGKNGGQGYLILWY